jgi:hypothetical protein
MEGYCSFSFGSLLPAANNVLTINAPAPVTVPITQACWHYTYATQPRIREVLRIDKLTALAQKYKNIC